jgi:hypothetical protein
MIQPNWLVSPWRALPQASTTRIDPGFEPNH